MTSSERPSPEPIPEKEASPAVLGGGEFWKRSGSLKCLELKGLGHPSRTLEGNSRKRSQSVSGVFPELFRNFFRKVPAVMGVWPKRGGGGQKRGGGGGQNLTRRPPTENSFRPLSPRYVFAPPPPSRFSYEVSALRPSRVKFA